MAFDLTKAESIFLKLAGISTAALGVFAAYSFYKNNVWQPKIEVLKVDYDNGRADLMINGRPFILVGESVYLIGFDWGIRFGSSIKAGSGKRYFDRIEVLKRNMVHKVIKGVGEKHSSFVGSPEVLSRNTQSFSINPIS
jgi:hypothetical protein